MGKVLIIDDDDAFLRLLEGHIHSRYPMLDVVTCRNPVEALRLVTENPELLLVDLEMPLLDGGKVVQFAVDAGIDRRRIIILSSRDAEYLHDRFPLGTCLAVMNKYEAGQKAVLDMVLSSLEKKSTQNQNQVNT